MMEISSSKSSVANAHSSRDLPRLVIGIVAEPREHQHLQLARSIELAAARLSELSVQPEILRAGSGWSVAGVPEIIFDRQSPADAAAATNDFIRTAFADPSAQWFLRLHPDCVLHRDAFARLVAASLAEPCALFEARRFPDENPKFYSPQTGETSWVGGECLLIPRAVYEMIGDFDPELGGHLADVDYSWRARQAGFTTRVCPAALYGSHGDREARALEPDRALLIAARYLAWKWNDPVAQRAAETAIVEHGFFGDSELPHLSAPTPAAGKDHSNVADFSDFPSFNKFRWKTLNAAVSTIAGQVHA